MSFSSDLWDDRFADLASWRSIARSVPAPTAASDVGGAGFACLGVAVGVGLVALTAYVTAKQAQARFDANRADLERRSAESARPGADEQPVQASAGVKTFDQVFAEILRARRAGTAPT